MPIKRSILRKIYLGIFITILATGTLYNENLSRRVCVKGYYEGIVVDKLALTGKSTTLYMIVDFKDLGVQQVVVSPTEYQCLKSGYIFQTQYSYNWILGAAGIVYVPRDPRFSPWLLFISAICRAVFLIGLSIWAIALIFIGLNKISYEDKPENE
jgi:hypothetical protein